MSLSSICKHEPEHFPEHLMVEKGSRKKKAAKEQMLLLWLQGNPTLDQGSVIYTTRMLMTTSAMIQLFGEVFPIPSKDTE